MRKLALLLFFSFCPYFEAQIQKFPQNCQEILASIGASPDFDVNVAHSFHSISVEDLQRFEPYVTIDNRMPTVNMNLSSEDTLLAYAPSRKTEFDDYFHTDGLKVLNKVLMHCDDPEFDMRTFNTLEKIIHEFHMKDMFAGIEKVYRTLKSQNAPSDEVCSCVLDIENNGILHMMRLLALSMREPKLVMEVYGYEEENLTGKKKSLDNVKTFQNFKTDRGPAAAYSWLKKTLPNQEKFAKLLPTTFHVPSAKMTKIHPKNINVMKDFPHVTGSESWKPWQKRLVIDIQSARMRELMHDAAIFAYCALNTEN